MKNLFLLLHAVACVLILAGCSTNLSVNEIDKAAAPNTVVNGIPFRMKEYYQITLYKLEGNKYQKIETKENYAVLPNLDHVYVLKLNGSALADGSLDFKMDKDNTLSYVKIVSTKKSPEFIAAVGDAKKSLADADAAKAKSEAAGKTAGETGVVAKEDARLAAFDAEKAAVIAAIELDALSPTASTLEKTTAERKLSRARILANQMARRAELALPFPDAGT